LTKIVLILGSGYASPAKSEARTEVKSGKVLLIEDNAHKMALRMECWGILAAATAALSDYHPYVERFVIVTATGSAPAFVACLEDKRRVRPYPYREAKREEDLVLFERDEGVQRIAHRRFKRDSLGHPLNLTLRFRPRQMVYNLQNFDEGGLLGHYRRFPLQG
jgi:hypothetical protein